MLTPDERRGAITLLVLLLTGVGWDALQFTKWRALPPGSSGDGSASTVAPLESDAGPAALGASSSANDGAARTDSTAARVDLNRATSAELEALPGIGPVLAHRICEHRRVEGPFHSVEELRAVRGVGPRLMERLRGRVKVRAAP